MPHSECCLCSQIEGRQDNDLIAAMLPHVPYARRVMMETASFAVIPSLGALAPGHSLVCPKRHARSFSQISASEYAEFLQIKSVLTSTLFRLYGSRVHLFEHGMATEGNRVLCTVDHAHMHFVPLPDTFDIDAIQRLRWIRIEGAHETIAAASEGSEYIFYEDPNGEARLLRPDTIGFQSQYMRKLIAESISCGENWNWRERPDAMAADAAWRVFVAATPELRS
jgi:ATP adenylyltransferase